MSYTPVTYKVLVVDDPLQDYPVRLSTPTDISTLPTSRTALPVNGLYVDDTAPTPVRITVEQVRATTAGDVYRVTTTVTETLGIAAEIFVFSVVDDSYQHVATVYDMDTYPASKSLAVQDGAHYYRLDEAVQSSLSLQTAEDCAAYTLSRISLLQPAYYEYKAAFEGTDSHTYPEEV